MLSPEEEEELSSLQQLFHWPLVQTIKCLSFVRPWGMSPQPGSTYYLQKLSHNIFGIDDYSTNESSIYIIDEWLGPNNSDHTISHLHHYLSNVPSWIKRVHVILGQHGQHKQECVHYGVGFTVGAITQIRNREDIKLHACWSYKIFRWPAHFTKSSFSEILPKQ